MPKYANPSNSYVISDRSGFRYRAKDTRKEWNGLRVGKDAYEDKHPQLDPRYHPTDPQSLQNAKPQIISATVDLGINLVARNIFGVVTQSISQFNPIPAPGAFETVVVNTMQPQTQNKDIKMQSSVGSPTVVIS